MSTAPEKRTQAERSETTRAALIAAGRRLFAARGYAAVGTEEIVREAGVTRGALYHHFAGKRELLAAVYEQIESEITEQLAASVVPGASVLETLQRGADEFLDHCLEPEVQQIVLLDAPAVLGWEEWREIGLKYGFGLVEETLKAAMEAGLIENQPSRPLAHLVLGAIDEAALVVARAPDDGGKTRREIGDAVERFIDHLRSPG